MRLVKLGHALSIVVGVLMRGRAVCVVKTLFEEEKLSAESYILFLLSDMGLNVANVQVTRKSALKLMTFPSP